MNKLITITAMLALVLTAGCTSLKGIIGQDNPYDAGWFVVDAYVIGRPFVSENRREVVKQVYLVVGEVGTDNLDALTDNFLKATVAKVFSDATQEERQSVFVVFKRAKDRLVRQIDREEGTPSSEVFGEFMRGVNDAVEYYSLIESEEQAASDWAAISEILEESAQ